MPDSIKIDELSFPFKNNDILSIYSINQANTPKVGSLKSVEKLRELLNMSSLVLAARVNNEIIVVANDVLVEFVENSDSFSENDWKELYKLSEKTFVEETESLKQSGAGAGLTDND